MRVYDQAMVRKCATFAFALALIVALGRAVSHTHPLKAPSASTGFSTPYEPALPSWKAAGESPVASTFDSTFAAANAAVPAVVLRASRPETVSQPIPPPAPADFPPLFHRPPPARS